MARSPDTGARLAAAAHVGSLAAMLAFWAWLDRGVWFFGDEWDFLVDRGLGYSPGSTHGIWYPHNEHWSTLPILAWRAIFSLWHLGSYWPYLGLLLAVQVGVVHLVWRACRRAGVSPWVSTAATLMLGLLGAGAEDFGWAFQVGFVGSVGFGLLAFDLLDRPASSSVNRLFPAGRDLGVSAALLASLMCSTVGDAMVVGAGVLAFARLSRGRAVKVLWPPVACYLVWFIGVGRRGIAAHSDHFDLSTFTALPAYVWRGLSSALGQSFNLGDAGSALLVALAAWVVWQGRRLWAQHPALLGLCASSVAFYVLAALGRDASGGAANASRYVYVALAMLVPVIALALSGTTGRGVGAPGRLAAVGLLLFTTLGNIGQARAWTSTWETRTSGLKTQILALGELVAAGVPDVSGPVAAPVPGDPNLHVSDIAQLEREGVLPRPHLSAAALVNERAVLALGVWNGLDMTLSATPFSGTRFELARVAFGSETGHKGACAIFSPQTVSPAMEIWLRVPQGAGSASVELGTGPASSAPRRVDAQLVPRRPPSSAPVPLVFPPSGSGWLDDDQPFPEVLLTWAGPGPLSLCGLHVLP